MTNRLAHSTLLLASFSLPALLAQQVKPTPNSAAPAADPLVTLSPFEVNTSRDVGFVAASSLAGGRLATDLADTPVAYSVQTREFLDLQPRAHGLRARPQLDSLRHRHDQRHVQRRREKRPYRPQRD